MKFYVTSVAFSPQGDKTISDSYDTTVIIWDIATGEEKFYVAPNYNFL